MMYRRFAYSLPTLLLSGFFFGACSSGNVPPVPETPEEQKAYVNLCISVAANNPFAPGQPGSRAIYDDNNFFGEAEPPYEEINSLRVILVDVDPAKGNKVEYNEIITRGAEGTSTAYVPNLNLRTTPGGNRIIYLIANEAGLDHSIVREIERIRPGSELEPSTMDDMEIRTEDNGGPFFDDGSTYVPMTEYFEVSIPELPADWEGQGTYYMPPVNLFVTRTAVKFSFIAIVENESHLLKLGQDYRISEIVVNSIGNREYLFPQGTVYSPVKSFSIADREIIQYDVPHSFRNTPLKLTIPNDAYTEGSTYFGEQEKDAYGIEAGKKIFTFAPKSYYPETKLPDDSDFTIDVTVDWADNYGNFPTEMREVMKDIKLDNMPYGLPRNTHIMVILTMGDHLFQATATVLPYTGVWLNPQFGIDPPKVTDPEPEPEP